MTSQPTYSCVECSTAYPDAVALRCHACGGLVDVDYDLSNVTFREGGDSLVRYADLLPFSTTQELSGVGSIELTPCVEAPHLARAIGLERLYLKDETGLPTGTTKDRATAVSLVCYKELGVREFAVVSTGNAATSMAHRVRSILDLTLHVFIGDSFVPRLWFEPADNIIVHTVAGDLVAAQRAAHSFAAETHIPLEGGFFSIPKREGLKLAYLEALDQVAEPPDVVVQAVSSAIGLWGAYRGYQQRLAMGDLRRMPRLVCVQQESCCPMYAAYEEGAPAIEQRHIVNDPRGIAAALLRGDPTPSYGYVKRMLDDTGGFVEVANEEEIRHAAEQVAELEGIGCGFAAACAVAGVARAVKRGRVRPDDVVLVNLTGRVGT